MEIRKTATVTWIKYNNFGTYLQAYALQQVVLRLGYKNDILDDSSIHEEGFCQKHDNVIRKLLYKLRIILDVRYWRFNNYQKKSDALYADFRRNNLLINVDIHPLYKLNEQYDAFICGSDQIWFPSRDIFSPYYYLDFAEKKKIAYAPSLGVMNYPQEFIPKVKPLLEHFDYLSVREQQGERLLTSFISKDIKTVLDPTLLLDAVTWKKLVEKESPIKGDYILCYFLSPNAWYLDFVRKFAARQKMPIKIFCTNPCYVYWEGCVVAGPQEFLNYIYHSNYFFTDSFHGTIFSILFEKRFCTFKRFDEGSTRNQNSRIVNLFSLLGLQDYFIARDELDKVELLPKVDYNQVVMRLDVLRQQSLNYLIQALKD